MYLKKFWSPGIVGFVILASEVLFTYKAGDKPLAEFSRLAFLTLPLVLVLCLGAFVEVVPARKSETTPRSRSKILLWLDIILGFIGTLGIGFLYLVADPLHSSVSDRIGHIVVFLVIGGLGYVLFFKWKVQSLFKRLAVAAIWMVAFFLSYIALLETMTGDLPAPNRALIVDDLWNLSSNCLQYRSLSHSMGGGNGSYIGYIIPQRLASIENRTYSIASVSADTLVIRCVESHEGGIVTVRVDTNGHWTDWNLQGKLDPWDDDWRDGIWVKWFRR